MLIFTWIVIPALLVHLSTICYNLGTRNMLLLTTTQVFCRTACLKHMGHVVTGSINIVSASGSVFRSKQCRQCLPNFAAIFPYTYFMVICALKIDRSWLKMEQIFQIFQIIHNKFTNVPLPMINHVPNLAYTDLLESVTLGVSR